MRSYAKSNFLNVHVQLSSGIKSVTSELSEPLPSCTAASALA